MVKALHCMGIDQKGVIKQVSARGELGRRIRDMGLIPGAEFRVVGRAPLNDPTYTIAPVDRSTISEYSGTCLIDRNSVVAAPLPKLALSSPDWPEFCSTAST